MAFIPAHPALVLGIMHCKYSWNRSQVITEGKTITHHKRNEPGMVVMAMNNPRLMLPFIDPVAYSDLKGHEPFCIVVIAIDLFPVQ